MNAPTLIILLVLAVIVAFSIRAIVKGKKSGKSCASCGGGCSHCHDQNSGCSK